MYTEYTKYKPSVSIGLVKQSFTYQLLQDPELLLHHLWHLLFSSIDCPADKPFQEEHLWTFQF